MESVFDCLLQRGGTVSVKNHDVCRQYNIDRYELMVIVCGYYIIYILLEIKCGLDPYKLEQQGRWVYGMCHMFLARIEEFSNN